MTKPKNYSKLDLSNRNISGILDLRKYRKYNNLEVLKCSNNLITKIINIPPTLKYLDCSNNLIEEITEINHELEYFNFENNPIIKLYYPQKQELKSYPETLMELTFSND